MTVPTSDNREEYTGNDATTSFDYAFKIFEDSDLQVYLQAADGTETLLVLNTDYSVSGAGDLAGGSVTYPLSGDPLASDEKLIILRVLDVVQETDLRNQGAYYPQVVEDEFDRSRMIDQQQQEEIDRALKRPAAEDGYDADGRQIKNGAAATDGSDVVIKSQVDNRFANDVITKTAGRWDGKGLRATNFQTSNTPTNDELINAQYLEAYVASVIAGGEGVIPETYFFDGDGSTTVFSTPGITALDPSSYTVTIDGIDQRPGTDYTVDIASETVTFVEAPPAPYPGTTDNVMVRVLAYKRAISEAQTAIVETATGIETVPEALDKRTIYAGSVAELQALSLSNGYNAFLTDEDRAGEFVFDSSDLSATLVASSVTSTSVDSGTDTITSAAHGLVKGDGVITESSVNGLTANTVYWVINTTTDTFQLSDTFDGSAFNLTGTANFTVKQLLDPLQGVYVVPTSDPTGTNGAWVRTGYDALKLSFWGATPGADNAAELTALANFAPVGAKVVVDVESETNYTVFAKANQTWAWEKYIRLADKGTAVIKLFDAKNLDGILLINPLLDMDFENNVYDGLPGTQHTLSFYGTSGVVLGGTIKNGLDNHIQGDSGTVSFYGTVFDRCGEHSVYASSGNVAPAPPKETNWTFEGCHFIDPALITDPTEGHYTQCRGVTGVKFIGCTFEGPNALTPKFLLNATNSTDILFDNCTVRHLNHRVINADSDCQDIRVVNSVLSRNSSELVSGIIINSLVRNDGEKVQFRGCSMYEIQIVENAAINAEIIQTNFYNVPFRFDLYFPVTLTDVEVHMDPASTSATAVFVRGGLAKINNIKVFVNGSAVTSGIRNQSGTDGYYHIDGAEFPDWTNSLSQTVFAVSGTFAGAMVIKGVRLDDSITDANTILIGDNVGDVLLGECVITSGGATVSATGNTLVDYGNIFGTGIS